MILLNESVKVNSLRRNKEATPESVLEVTDKSKT